MDTHSISTEKSLETEGSVPTENLVDLINKKPFIDYPAPGEVPDSDQDDDTMKGDDLEIIDEEGNTIIKTQG